MDDDKIVFVGVCSSDSAAFRRLVVRCEAKDARIKKLEEAIADLRQRCELHRGHQCTCHGCAMLRDFDSKQSRQDKSE